MGMYDYVKCEYPLPDSRIQDEVFQTKDFDNELATYRITREGRLVYEQVRYELVPEAERPYYGTPEWDKDKWVRLIGHLKAIPLGDEDMRYHGNVVFYAFLGEPGQEGYEWFEFQAWFTNGQLEWIRPVTRGKPG